MNATRFLALPTTFVALASVCGCPGRDSAAAPVGTTLATQMDCADVTTAAPNIPNLVVTSATSMPATTTTGTANSYPAHCRLLGKINQRTGIDGKAYAVGFDIRLPLSENWNGKFFYSGDAGSDGTIAAPYGNVG